MVSKRKRAEEGETDPVTTPTRSTRSSTRQTKSTTATATKKTAKKKKVEDSADEDSKKSRVPKGTEETMRTKGKSSKSKQNDVSDNVDKDLNGAVASLFFAFALMLFTGLFCCRSNSHHPDDPAEPSPSTHKQDSGPPETKTEPYNAANVQTIFNDYADRDDADTISAENFERLCTDANVPMEGPMPLILLWLVDAQELGTIKKDKWSKAMQDSKIFLGDMEELLLTNKPPIPEIPAPSIKGNRKSTGAPPYDRVRYNFYAQDRGSAFSKLYSALFTIAKTAQSRNIDVEIAKAFWSVLLVRQYPIITEVVEYITDGGTYKAVNKDVWSMVLEFCKTVNPNLDNYEADGAWPTLIDEFVTWKRERSGKKPSVPTTDQA